MLSTVTVVSHTALDDDERVLAACADVELARAFIAQHLKDHDPDNEYYLGEDELVAGQMAFIVPVIDLHDDGNGHSEWYTLTTVELKQ